MDKKEVKNEIVEYKDEVALENQVDKKALALSKQISMTDNKRELNSLYYAFKINNTKKNVFRINKLNNLLDKITDEATARFEQRPGEMSNKEVLDYMSIVQDQIDRSKSSLDKAQNLNLTQVNNTTNNVNVNIDNKTQSLNSESRKKVIDFIKDIIKEGDLKETDNIGSTEDNNIIEAEVEEKEIKDNE